MIEEKIPVQILGQTYEILGNPSEALYYNSLARFVEEKMKEIKNSLNIVSDYKIAVLASLNIADDLFRDKENKSHSGKSMDKRHEELIQLINKVLEEQSAEPADLVLKEPAVSSLKE